MQTCSCEGHAGCAFSTPAPSPHTCCFHYPLPSLTLSGVPRPLPFNFRPALTW